MLIVISPAKKLNTEYEESTLKRITQPLFAKQSQELVNTLKTYQSKDFMDLMGVSEKIADLNRDRYQAWQRPFNQENAKPAILTFKGDVYQGMQVESFTAKDFDYAQQHLRILSGLYGCLRPKDLMQAYRLEMGISLNNSVGKNLYTFWQDTITQHLNNTIKEMKAEYLINLASNEYFKSVDSKKLQAEVITPVFKEYKNGQYKIISFLAKKARGMMSAYLIKNKISQIDDIKTFNEQGYRFSKGDSTDTQLVFLRKQD